MATGLILAGGRGRRVGGRDKGLLLHLGRPLVAWVHDLLAGEVDEVLISANRNAQAYAAYGEVVADLRPDFPGPLAGLEAALLRCRSDSLMIVPCDVSGLSPGLIRALLDGLDAEPAIAACVLHDGSRLQPLLAAVRPRLLTDLRAWLDGGGAAAWQFWEWIGARVVAWPVDGGLGNRNRSSELR